MICDIIVFFFQAEDGIRDHCVTGVQTCALPISRMPAEARKKAEAELKKLKLMSPMSAEATVVRNYIDVLTGLPWSKKTKIKHDLANAEDVLNADHFGLEKVKDRILEYLAVQQRVDKVKAPILCLVGPPGVGKTSLGQSIAKATGRKYVRMALGGLQLHEHPARAAGPHGSDPPVGLHRGRKGQHRHPLPAAQATHQQRCEGRRNAGRRVRHPRHRALLHA